MRHLAVCFLGVVVGLSPPAFRLRAEPLLVRAFVFGARAVGCASPNDPAVPYVTVEQSNPAALEYSAARGWGYEVADAGLSTYGRFGPLDDSPNFRGVFPETCPGKIYNSNIGLKPLAPCISEEPPCLPPEGAVFRADVPNGTYRFVAAVGDALYRHAHRIVVEDGGRGPAGTLGSRFAVLADNFDQALYPPPSFARVGFDGRLPPEVAGATFVDMDASGLPASGPAESPVLEVTHGYIRVHQLKAATAGSDGNGADLVVLELWRVADSFDAVREGATWKYFRGLAEASSPDAAAWRRLDFDDGAWVEGRAPLGYGEAGIATDLSLLSPPMEGNYTSLFLRRTFFLPSPEIVSQLVARAHYDDGFVLWVNGVEVLRVNVPGAAGDPVPYDGLAASGHEYILPEDYDLPDPSGYLVEGANVAAVQVLNASRTSSDLYFDLAVFDPALPDVTPPEVVEIVPPPGAVVRSLSEVRVRFSEPVAGVDAADLTVGGVPAASASGSGAGPYVFAFPPAGEGEVEVRWDLQHGIADLAEVPNAFRGGSWTCLVDPNAPRGALRLNEILALNGSALSDEDGDETDWIEIANAGDGTVDLGGYSLSDDPEDPRLWVFPPVLLRPGELLVVFASGKDRRDPLGTLHTNFELSAAGEYLGLFSPESPAEAVSEFFPRYPPQRADISYGFDASGRLAYLATPTPGAANSAALSYEGFAADPAFSPPRGFYEAPADVTIWSKTPGAAIRYTLDGSEPTASYGTLYEGPVRVAPGGGRGAVPLRAIAYKPGLLPSRVTTHTYIFPEAVMAQAGAPDGFPATWRGQPADYAMDPRVVGDPGHTELVRRGLRSLPTISISTSVEDLFGPNGIYANPSQEGIAWERPASVEFIHPDGRTGFSADCGLRIQGGTSTSGWKSIKLSLRLVFRADYGLAKLRCRLFPDTRVDAFDTVVLDAHLNLTWNHPDHGQRVLAQYVRDCYTSDLQNALGGFAPHDAYAHVYLDGLYWGLYDVHERPDHAFAAAYFGGDKSEYDALRHNLSTVVEGDASAWNAAFAFARGGLADDLRYLEFGERVDVPNFIDYMIANFFVGNTDWAHQNWYSTRWRAGGPIRYHSWDAEHVLKNVSENRIGANNSGGPTELFQLLRENVEFRLQVADHVHRHFSRGGALYVDPLNPAWDPSAPERNRPADAYLRRIDEVDGYVRREIFGDASVGSGIACESARWGDAKSPADEYTRNGEWLAELERLLRDYFPRRSGIVLEEFRAAGLYPAVGAPVLSHPGGTVEPGFRLALSKPAGTAGTIYFTTDGTDPRVPFAGQVSARARAYTSPIEVFDYTTVKARTLSGTSWSALAEATFALASPEGALRVSEILYNPPEGPGCEFLELENSSDATVGLSGAYFADGIRFVFPTPTALGPGEFLVLVSDPVAFSSKHPGVKVGGVFSDNLSNGGERLRLVGRDGAEILSLRYDDEGFWPIAPDGFGWSLVLADPSGDPSSPETWRASASPGVYPGATDPAPAAVGFLVNE
ncbi:MAG: lamin tail domain-containing protein, partial [Planctomycetota bacterium]